MDLLPRRLVAVYQPVPNWTLEVSNEHRPVNDLGTYCLAVHAVLTERVVDITLDEKGLDGDKRAPLWGRRVPHEGPGAELNNFPEFKVSDSSVGGQSLAHSSQLRLL